MNSSESVRERSVSLPVFTGKQEDFQMWWTRFSMYAVVKQFKNALKKEADLPDKEDDVLDETKDKMKIEAKKRNEVAMANLAMAFTNEACMGLIYKSMTTEWPSGLAYKVIEELMAKYQPQDTITRVEIRQMLNRVSMKKDEDPATLFEQISSIRNRYSKTVIHDGDLIAVVLDAAPRSINQF